MSRPPTDEIITQQHIRYFYQRNGAAPENDLKYAGQDGQFINIESATNPKTGGTSAINVQDPGKFKAFKQVGTEISAPDRASFTTNFLQAHGAIPRQLYNLSDCVTTYYDVRGNCKDPSDFINGWTDFVKILANATVDDSEEGGGSFDSDSMVQDDLSNTADRVYVVGALSFGEEAATQVTVEVVDITYGNRLQCGDCGPNDDGTTLIYGLTDGVTGSPGSLPQVVYSTDSGTTWTLLPVSTSLATDTAVSIDVVGQNLMVTVQTAASSGAYYLSEINSLTGVPGTFSAAVTSGFSATNQPNDVYVANPREVYFAADNGYIYKSTNILQGVTAINPGDTTANNLNRIDGLDENVIAVGDSATVVFSTNRGDTWGTTTTAPGAANLTAVEILGDFRYWVGDAAGAVYWTNNQGASAWTQLTLPVSSAGTPANISDIVFVNDEVGYIVGETSDPTAIFFNTMNGGADWMSDASGSRVAGTWPTLDRVNRVAYPIVPNMAVASNNVAMAGLAGDGTDGIILLGIAGVKG